MINYLRLLCSLVLVGCNSGQKTDNSILEPTIRFGIELSDTIYLGGNVGHITDFKSNNEKGELLLTVLIENEYDKGKITIDTFSNGTLSPWFGVFAIKEGNKTIKGTLLEEYKPDEQQSDSILKIHRTFIHFSKDVIVIDSIPKE